MTIPKFNTVAQTQKWLAENNRLVIDTKKATMKCADGVSYILSLVDKDDNVIKGVTEVSKEITSETQRIKVRSIINTTKLLDSHDDVHIDQLWNKSLKENGENYLVREHKFDFENTITDNVKAFVKRYEWKELGYHYKGDTQALVFDSVIDKTESPFMFNKYATGKVKQHSVGMRYVNLFLCLSSEIYGKEYLENWEKYFPEIANYEQAEEQGYFYAVTQAKVIEGSAVMKGSNFVTPTTSVEAAKNTSEEVEEIKEETAKDISTEENKFFNFNLY